MYYEPLRSSSHSNLCSQPLSSFTARRPPAHPPTMNETPPPCHALGAGTQGDKQLPRPQPPICLTLISQRTRFPPAARTPVARLQRRGRTPPTPNPHQNHTTPHHTTHPPPPHQPTSGPGGSASDVATTLSLKDSSAGCMPAEHQGCRSTCCTDSRDEGSAQRSAAQQAGGRGAQHGEPQRGGGGCGWASAMLRLAGCCFARSTHCTACLRAASLRAPPAQQHPISGAVDYEARHTDKPQAGPLQQLCIGLSLPVPASNRPLRPPAAPI